MFRENMSLRGPLFFLRYFYGVGIFLLFFILSSAAFNLLL